MDALIGHTGFVGGTLASARSFEARFNSTNIEQIRGCRFDRVVCAGVSAVKWQANQEPERDWQAIARLIACLEHVEAARFVLVSTIDVYRETSARTEADLPTAEGLHPYGRHRLALESFVAGQFGSHKIVRLPALFGTGLKKNALFDLLNRHQTEKIPANAQFQWYPLHRLADDLDRIEAAALRVINITSEPLAMDELRRRFFPGVPLGPVAADPPRYDLQTLHDRLLRGSGGYHLRRDSVLREIAAFVGLM